MQKVVKGVLILAIVTGSTIGGTLFLTHKLASQPQPTSSYDVVVVGAGPGGIAASLQAARMGARVALLEPTDRVGGQITAAGVSTMDEGSVAARRSGIYKEFVGQIQAYYASRGKAVNTCYFETDSLCVDPTVAEQVLRTMLGRQSARLHLYTQVKVDKVMKRGNIVTGVEAGGRVFMSKVLVDGDEYGDVLAMAGAAYRLGDGTSEKPDPRSCIQSITYTAIMKYYPLGVPPGLRFTSAPPGYDAQLAGYFAKYLNNNGVDHFQSKSQRNLTFTSYNAFRGLPDVSNPDNYNVMQQHGHVITRASLDLGNDYPRTGDLSVQYISDPKYRLQADCQAKLLTLQLAYYIQHDLRQTNWSVANDEGYDTTYNRSQHCTTLAGFEAFEDQLPVAPYVREGRRLIGVETLTGNEVAKAEQDPAQAQKYPDSIAVGYYPMDLHACHAPLEAALDSPSDLKQVFTGGAFEVPLGTLIPEKIDGLLAVEKNISVSREANGAIREQPIAMDTGQAAGALAALAARSHQQPRGVPYQSVQKALEADGAVTVLGH